MPSTLAVSFALILIVACSGDTVEKARDNFFDKELQAATERIIAATINPVDSLNLSDYGVFNGILIEVDDRWIYVADWKVNKVLAIAKGEHGSYRFIGHGTGDGPGEADGFADIAVGSGNIYSITHPHRIATFTAAGAFISDTQIDIPVGRLAVAGDKNILAFAPKSTDYLFHLIDADGLTTDAFGQVTTEEPDLGPGNFLRYAGSVEVHDGHLYYAGFSESLFKKYTLDGELVYSVATIDNHSSEHSYFVQLLDGMNIARYTPQALFSTISIAVYDRYCIVQPADDTYGVRHRVFDVYDTKSGQYVESYGIYGMPTRFALDDGHIYTIEKDLNPETGETDRYVKIYDNMLGDR